MATKDLGEAVVVLDDNGKPVSVGLNEGEAWAPILLGDESPESYVDRGYAVAIVKMVQEYHTGSGKTAATAGELVEDEEEE